MTVYKDKMNTIEFEVKDYSFESFEFSDKIDSIARNFEFQDITSVTKKSLDQHQKTIKLERSVAKANHFEIAPMVLEHRGLIDQEKREREDLIEQEVSRRIEEIKQAAFLEGKKLGQEQGREEVIEQMRHEVEQKISHLSEMVSQVLETQSDLMEKSKKDTYNVVKNLTKWIVLRELKEDDDYLKRLLEKLILEINTKSNLLIKVGQGSFNKMPDVLEHVQNTLGKFKNVRVEIDYDLDNRGLILESDNGIINASMKEQFKSINKLFETLGVDIEDDSIEEINE